MKFWPPVLLIACFSVAVSASSTPSPVRAMSECETLTGWAHRAELVADARQGRFAVSADMPPGETGFLNLDHAHTGIDLSAAHALAFW